MSDSYDHRRTDNVMPERAQKYLKLEVGSIVEVDRSDEGLGPIAGIILEVPPNMFDDFLVDTGGSEPERIYIDDLTYKGSPDF